MPVASHGRALFEECERRAICVRCRYDWPCVTIGFITLELLADPSWLQDARAAGGEQFEGP